MDNSNHTDSCLCRNDGYRIKTTLEGDTKYLTPLPSVFAGNNAMLLVKTPNSGVIVKV